MTLVPTGPASGRMLWGHGVCGHPDPLGPPPPATTAAAAARRPRIGTYLLNT